MCWLMCFFYAELKDTSWGRKTQGNILALILQGNGNTDFNIINGQKYNLFFIVRFGTLIMS